MKSIVFMQGNPVYKGHMALFESVLEYSDTLDVFISSRRNRPRDLPYCIRKRAVEVAVQNFPYRDRVNILDVQASYCEIRSQLYAILAVGSDIAHQLVAPTEKWKPGEAEYFLSFPSLLVLQRPGSLLTDEVAQVIRARVQNLIISPPKVEFSSTDLRRRYRDGEDISTMLPESVWDVISNHVSCFHSET